MMVCFPLRVSAVQSAVEGALVRAARLRQAVPQGDDMLKSAFEGRL
jgi:hypothetical protein